MTKKFYMLIGPPGCGKSTFVESLNDFAIVSTDEYIQKYADKHNISYSDAFQKVPFKEAHNYAMNVLHNAIKYGKNIVWDQTNMTAKSRRKKLEMIPNDYTKTAIYWALDDDELTNRLQHREDQTGKHIPKSVVDNFLKTFTPPSKSEGFDHIIRRTE